MIVQVQTTIDHVVRLRDGRSMGYAQYGDPNGFPVVNAHGGMACRLDVAAAAPIANQVGVRLISPDRPGIGLSDPQPGRTVLDGRATSATCSTESMSTGSPSWGGRWAGNTRPRSATRCGIG